MIIKVPDYTPSAKQSKFHTSSTFETFFAGAAGPGKTAALCAEAITSALEIPKTNCYLFRRTLAEIMLSIHAEISKQLSPYNNATKSQITFNGSQNRWVFPNGSFIQYAYCQYDGDVYRYQSAEIHFLGIDELTHFKEEWYDYLKTRVRSSGGQRLRVMAASNPGNVGHGWCKKYFVDLGDQTIHADKNGRTRQYIKATIDDHPDAEFRKQYIVSLESIKNERLRKSLRWGDWDAFEGQVFMEWDERQHVIEQLPPGLLNESMRYIGHDIGRRDHGAAEWVFKAPENEYGVEHYYAYREIYQQWKDAKEWGKDIKYVIDEEPIEFVVLPHDAFAIGHGASRSYADTFAEMDIPYERANSLTKGSRMHRQDLLHQLLQISPDGTPYLQIHKNCQNLIRTIPDLPYSETIREQIDDKAEDHAYDALTYALMVIDDPESWLVAPQFKQPEFPVTPVHDGYADGIDIEKILKSKADRDWRST